QLYIIMDIGAASGEDSKNGSGLLSPAGQLVDEQQPSMAERMEAGSRDRIAHHHPRTFSFRASHGLPRVLGSGRKVEFTRQEEDGSPTAGSADAERTIPCTVTRYKRQFEEAMEMLDQRKESLLADVNDVHHHARVPSCRASY
ncbi:hypothetical protein PENTCL1PPCAC_11305, partial [Pristionchus entomophagus]